MLKRVSIQNFKSLKAVTLDLQRVNLLIGPNNSGKTNFLKALEYFNLSVLQDDIASERLARKVRYVNSSEPISIKLTFQRKSEEIEFSRKIIFTSTVDLESSQRIFREGIVIDTDEQGYPDVAFLRSQLAHLRIYKPDPNKLTKPGPVGNGADLVTADASNVIGFLDRMLGNKYRKTVFNQIEDDLHKCVPEFDQIELEDAIATEESIRIHGEESRKYSFKRLGLINEQKGISYWADELSEGTLYFIALLCIINQPNPPKLLLLEEPEKGIHPRRIREVMDFIFRLAEEKDVQVILTTHNEHVLDEFATRPEAVFVFDKDDDGATYVKNLQRDIIDPTNARNGELDLDPVDLTSNLSENWLYGLLGGVPAIL